MSELKVVKTLDNTQILSPKHGVSIHFMTQLYVSCDPEENESAVFDMNAGIEEIHQWMHTDPLKLNDSKTGFLTLGTKYMFSQLENIFLKIED